MPRPTAAQFAYGTCTVIFSTLAMLLLSRTSSGPGVALIAVAALALGLLVAMTVPQPRTRAGTEYPWESRRLAPPVWSTRRGSSPAPSASDG